MNHTGVGILLSPEILVVPLSPPGQGYDKDAFSNVTNLIAITPSFCPRPIALDPNLLISHNPDLRFTDMLMLQELQSLPQTLIHPPLQPFKRNPFYTRQFLLRKMRRTP
jgi:hypothetical protein